MIKLSKNIIIGGIVIAVILIAVLLYFVFSGGSALKLSSVEAKNGSITEKINLTGQVKASQGVDLAFESQGKVVANYVKVGDKIYAGQPLLAIDSSILQSQLKQAQAQLDILSISTVQNKVDASVESLYANSLNAAQKSVTIAKDILLSISDIQSKHFKDYSLATETLAEKKFEAVLSLLGSTNSFVFSQANSLTWDSQTLSPLNGGATELIQNAINNQTPANIDLAISAVMTSLQDINNFINEIPIDLTLSSAERSVISSAKSAINTEIITTSANKQSLNTIKVNNSAIVTAANGQLEAAQANIDAIRTQISKTVIAALFNGQVDKDNAVVGQIVSSNVPVITISNSNLEIDTYIPEIDLADAKIGGQANITLDAFGNGAIFPATIFSIDLAPTTVNGVSVYGAKLKFNDTDDTTQKMPNPGMTANITLISDTHTNVLLIPKSAVIQSNNKYFVIVDKGNSQKETREVKIGLRDNNNIEITSGLTAGEKVFAY